MVLNNISTFNYGLETRVHFEGYNKENDTNPTTKKPGIRSHDWFTAFVLRILGFGHLITELETESGVIYLNKNSFDQWREAQAKELNFSYIQTKLPTAEEIVLRHNLNLENAGVINFLPSELMFKIIKQAKILIFDLFQCRLINKFWCANINIKLAKFTSDNVFGKKDWEKHFEIKTDLQILLPKSIVPPVKVFGKKAWEKYFNYKIEGEVPPPPKNLLKIIKTLRDKIKAEKEPPTFSLLLMPNGLTFKKLINLLQKGGQFSITSHHVDPNFDCGYKSHTWILMTNEVIGKVDSVCKWKCPGLKEEIPLAWTHELLVESIVGNKNAYPRPLDAMVCSFMNLNSSGKNIFEKTSIPCMGPNYLYWGSEQKHGNVDLEISFKSCCFFLRESLFEGEKYKDAPAAICVTFGTEGLNNYFEQEFLKFL